MMTRRGLVKGLAAATAGLAVARTIPEAVAAASLCPYCGVAPFGPLHRYLHATSPAPAWADQIIARESGWDPSAKNPYSTAAGLAQFLDSTWAWGQERFGIYGSPYDPYAAIAMMSAFLRAGEYYHWACTVESGCAG